MDMEYSPKANDTTYEDCLKKASFLVDNGYVCITTGYTFETLIDDLIKASLNDKQYP